MRQKIIAVVLGAGLLSLAAIGAFASQDFVHTQENPTANATVTEQPQATETEQPEATETERPEATKTEQPEATETEQPDATETGGERDIKGIPTTNPNFHDADSDGTCDHGEAAVKTTPAGTQVRVPCEATHDGSGQSHDHTPEAGTTPEANHDSSH